MTWHDKIVRGVGAYSKAYTSLLSCTHALSMSVVYRGSLSNLFHAVASDSSFVYLAIVSPIFSLVVFESIEMF